MRRLWILAIATLLLLGAAGAQLVASPRDPVAPLYDRKKVISDWKKFYDRSRLGSTRACFYMTEHAQQTMANILVQTIVEDGLLEERHRATAEASMFKDLGRDSNQFVIRFWHSYGKVIAPLYEGDILCDIQQGVATLIIESDFGPRTYYLRQVEGIWKVDEILNLEEEIGERRHGNREIR